MRLIGFLSFAFFAILSTANAQTGIEISKCYPSGSSLTRAQLSRNSAYITFSNRNNQNRLFEIATGNLLVVLNDGDQWLKTISPYMMAEDETQKFDKRFTYKETRIDPNNYNSPYRLSVYDTAGKLVQEVELPYVSHYSFNARNGDLVTDAKKVYLHTPGRKQKKLPKEAYGICGNAFFSPDGRYMISAEGHITDLVEATVKKGVFDNQEMLYFNVHFSEDSKKFTIPITAAGLQTFDAASGMLVDSVPIPAELPRFGYLSLGEGFKIMLLPNGKDYIYWMYYFSGPADAGLAYYIKDGVALTFCDPNWLTETIGNWAERFAANEARIKRERAEEEARAEYNRKNPPAPQVTQNEPVYKTRSVPVTCRYCNGAGKVNYPKLAVGKGQHYYTLDQYGAKKTEGVSHGYISVTCSACKGTGLIK